MAMTDDAALLHELEAYLAAAGRPALTDAQRDADGAGAATA